MTIIIVTPPASACPVKFLSSEINSLLMFNQGFEEDKLSIPSENAFICLTRAKLTRDLRYMILISLDIFFPRAE
jgi:hypothetical protein